MDPPDSTESNLSLSFDSEFCGHTPNLLADINDDFLRNFLFVSNENKESVITDQLENGCLEYDNSMKSSPENTDSDQEFKPPPIIGKVSAMIEKLKQQNKELKEKSVKQECELAEYEEKLSEKMSDLLQVQMERDSLKENLRMADSERESLKLKVEEKEAELKQFKGLIQKQVTEEEDIQALKKQMCNETRLLKKTEKDLQRITDLLTKSRETLKVLKRRNKKLVATVIEFGDILEHKELLPLRQKKYFQTVRRKFKDGDENLIEDVFIISSEEENTENNNSGEANNDLSRINIPVFNGLAIKKEETSSYSNGLPVDSNSEACSNGFLHAVKSSPPSSLEEDKFVDKSKNHKYAPPLLAKDSDVTDISHITCKTEETSNDSQNQQTALEKDSHLSPDSNFQSFSPGTESICSEDLDITDECFAQIKEGIKGWVLKSENYAPLSPLPASPSPKGNIQDGRSIQQNEYEVLENSGKLLPFSSVSASLESLPEYIQKKNVLSNKSSTHLKGKCERSESSDQFVPFSPNSCLDQQIIPMLPKPSSEFIKKKNALPSRNFSALERETERTKCSNKVIPTSLESGLLQQTTPISPEPSTEVLEKENVFSPQNSSSVKNDLDQFISFSHVSNQNAMPVSQEPSPECIQKKNIFVHQNSKGFEPHIEENSKSSNSLLNNTTASDLCVPPLVIPPELHYLSSSYGENNSFKILHQGGSVYDYLINPETKLSVCVLTVAPKRSSLPKETVSSLSSSVAKNVSVLPSEEERMKHVLSLYRATERRLTLINNQILNSDSSQHPNNPANEKLPRICVTVESENDISVNAVGNTCASENASDSGMDLDDTTFEDTQKDDSSVNANRQTDENQPLVTSSCDVSTPSKRRLTSNSFKYHVDTQSKLNDEKHSKSSEKPEELHHKDEAKPSVSETENRKKHLTCDNEELPCKKPKLETRLPNVVEGVEKSIVHKDNNTDLSATTTHHSPKISQQKLDSSSKNQSSSDFHSSLLKFQNSTSKNPPFSSITPELELKGLPLKFSPVSNVDSTQIGISGSPSKSQPLFKVSSPHQDLKSSSKEYELIKNISSSHLDLKESSENQLSPNSISLELELKNSPTENQHMLTVNNPELEQQNSQKSQSVSKTRSHLLGSKNSPLKNQLDLKDLKNPHLDLKESPETQPLPNSISNQPLPNSSSLELELKNSPSENQHMATVDNPEQEQQILQKIQSVPKTRNHLLDSKNSPLKNQLISNISNPQLELEHSVSENQSLSCVSNPQLELKNSPSKNQIISNVTTPKLDIKSSPLKQQNLSNISNSLLDVKNSPSKYQPLPNFSSPHLDIRNSPSRNQTCFSSPHHELRYSPLKSQHIDNIGSPDFFLDENSLVIDEDAGEESELQNTNISNLDREGVSKTIDGKVKCSVNVTNGDQTSNNSKKKSKQKKRKRNKALSKTTKKKLKLSTEEEPINIVFSIPKVLEQIEAIKIHDSLTESHFKRYAHTLFSAIINPSNASSTTSVLYQICDFLRSSRTNPLISFPIDYDTSVFFPLTERCIVSALIQADRKRKGHLTGLLAAAINSIYLLVLSKENISKSGLSAFCRVFTELCKNSKDRKKPIMLCCELIKARHKFAPILIASIMGVWPELFTLTDETPDGEVLLQGAIAYGLEKKPQSLTSADWKQCKAVFSKYLISPPVSDIDEATKNLIEILEEFLEETIRGNENMITDPLLMFAACNGWNWAEKNLSYFILTSLAKYAQHEEDERAFSLFCNLYADINLLSPNFESSSEILEQLFVLKEAFDYVKGCAARSMIKLYLLSNHKFPSCLCEWADENQNQLTGTPTELLIKQRLMSQVSFSENDIIGA